MPFNYNHNHLMKQTNYHLFDFLDFDINLKQDESLWKAYAPSDIKENNGDVFVVVGKSYEKEVINNDKDVMLLFYAPWCGHCKALHPKYEEVAKKLKAKNPKLLMAKIDATENEVENINISGFPTVKFYPGNKKDKAPLDYNGDRTVEDMMNFVVSNLGEVKE